MTYSSLKRASVCAIKEETTSGELIYPSAGTDFIPLRNDYTPPTPSLEKLENQELLNDIGAAKAYSGKESVEGSHPAYLKGKGSAGMPNTGLLFKSLFGAESSRTATDTVLAGCTTTVLNVTDASLYAIGQAILINGQIRNVKALDTTLDKITLNFALSAAPSAADVIQKSYGFKPMPSGHPTFSLWLYDANGTATEAVAGCKTTNIAMNMQSGQQAEVTFNYSGVKYYFNPIKITSSNKYIDIEDNNTDVVAAILTEKVYRTPVELADEIAYQASLVTGETISCEYISTGTDKGKFQITNAAGTFKLLWNTGANTANSAKTTIGFANTDDTGAATYKSDIVITVPYAHGFTPTYDGADNIIVKGAEFFLGSSTDNFCRKASVANVTIDAPVTDVDSICSDTGTLEKLSLSRAVTFTATVLLEKHDVEVFNKMIKNQETQAMVNIGPKSGSAFETGKCVNICIGKCTINEHNISGDAVIVANISGSGFVDTTDLKDIYVNFV